jgi:cell division protein ZapA (FtsZ GTPase activity inhibitor)
MEEEVSVRVEIAGRVYPLRVKAEEESDIRKAALLINSRFNSHVHFAVCNTTARHTARLNQFEPKCKN